MGVERGRMEEEEPSPRASVFVWDWNDAYRGQLYAGEDGNRKPFQAQRRCWVTFMFW